MTFLAITVVVTGKLIDHIGSEKKPNAFLYSSEEYWSMAARLNQ